MVLLEDERNFKTGWMKPESGGGFGVGPLCLLWVEMALS